MKDQTKVGFDGEWSHESEVHPRCALVPPDLTSDGVLISQNVFINYFRKWGVDVIKLINKYIVSDGVRNGSVEILRSGRVTSVDL